jgi:hypothetical protein
MSRAEPLSHLHAGCLDFALGNEGRLVSRHEMATPTHFRSYVDFYIQRQAVLDFI